MRVDADDPLIKAADFSLPSACPMNGLVTARSALRPQAGQIAVGGNTQSTNLSNPKLHIHRLIFAGKNGITPINYRKKRTSLTSMLCRPELRIHDVRHWVAASLLRSGVGVGIASQIMGHRDQARGLNQLGPKFDAMRGHRTGHIEQHGN